VNPNQCHSNDDDDKDTDRLCFVVCLSVCMAETDTFACYDSSLQGVVELTLFGSNILSMYVIVVCCLQ